MQTEPPDTQRSHHQQKAQKTGTTISPNTIQKKTDLKLTSQQPESALYSAQRRPEHSTGNSGSKRDRPSGEQGAAGQSTAEQRL
jgi:hypothetical protein